MTTRAEKDNRSDLLAEASFFRLPVVELEKYADRAPVSHKEVYCNLPLKHVGAQHSIGSKIIGIMHDRKVGSIFRILSIEYLLEQ